MKPFLPSALILLLLGLLAGCESVPAPEPAESAEAADTGDATFVTLNQTAREAVVCESIHTRTLPDGRLEVAANLRNQSDRPLRLKLNCVFKDAQGFSIKDETPFRTVEVAAGALETVRFAAASPTAKRFVVRVGTAR